MERMTRNEASAFLGVDAQTITNWVKRGLLGGYNDKESKRFWVNAEDAKRYSEKYRILSTSEEYLDKAIRNAQEKEAEIDEEVRKIEEELIGIRLSPHGKLGEQMASLFIATTDSVGVSKKVTAMFLGGKKIADIADATILTRERVRQIIVKGLRLFEEKIGELNALRQDVPLLKNEIVKLKVKMVMQMGNHNEGFDEELPFIFERRLIDCNLSVRALNCLKANDVDTIGDLVQLSKGDLMNTRNFGKKCMMELDNLIQKLGLEWNMPKAKVYARCTRRLESEEFIDDVFRRHFASIASELEKKYHLEAIEAMKMTYKEIKRYVGEKEFRESKVR